MQRKIIYPVNFGVTYAGKQNDCSVRALCNVTGIPYNTSEMMHKLNGRITNKGTSISTLQKTYKEAGVELVGIYGDTQTAWALRNQLEYTDLQENKGITLQNFIKKNPEGKYICLVRGHALAVVDGEVVDATTAVLANKRITAVFKPVSAAKAMLLEMDNEES